MLHHVQRIVRQRRRCCRSDEIDRLDEQLVFLLNARARCALVIGQLKKILKMEIYQPTREEAVLKHVRGVNPGPLDAVTATAPP